jgi:hypothetical protein
MLTVHVHRAAAGPAFDMPRIGVYRQQLHRCGVGAALATANIPEKLVHVLIPHATQDTSLPRIGHATAIGIAANQLERARKVDRRIHQRLHARTVTTGSDKKAQPRRATRESGGDEVWEPAVTTQGWSFANRPCYLSIENKAQMLDASQLAATCYLCLQSQAQGVKWRVQGERNRDQTRLCLL